MALAWVHALVIKNTSYVDVLWGYGVGVLGLIYLILAGENTDPARMALLKALILTCPFDWVLIYSKDASENRRMPAMPTFVNIWEKSQPWIFYFFPDTGILGGLIRLAFSYFGTKSKSN